MNGDNSTKRRAKPRYKGFETFLRRIAYNLGNSPSQTEVKIISCIPIDVSDLQHRILVLEKKIAEKQKNSKNDSRSAKSPPVVNTALYCPQFQPIRTTVVTAHSDDLIEHDNKKIHELSHSPNLQHSKIPQICVETPDNTMNNHDTNIENSTVTDHQIPTKTLNINQEANLNNHKKLIDLSKNSISHKNEEDENTDKKISTVNHHSKKMHENKRYTKKKNKLNTQLVYYTQTLSSPFSHGKTPIESDYKDNKYHAMKRAYLVNMIQKQYKPKLRNSSSDFSSPICRDFDTCHQFTCSYDSDICSCCRGKFQNIDQNLIPQTRNKIIKKLAISTSISTIDRKNDYYNSSYYDVVPVKEKSIQKKHTKKLPKDIAGLICYPERSRPKTRYRINQTKNLAIKNMKHQLKGNSYCSVRVKNLRSKVDTKVGYIKIRNDHDDNLITRKDITTLNIETQEPVRPVVLHKNQASLTHNFNNIECQTSAHSKPIACCYENKTEATLNQIKAILQSVLNEVKTTSQVKCASDKPLKTDAVVQKGLSQNKLQNSSQFLQSFTYSPYNITPYMNSYSSQLPSSSLCCPSLPYHHLRYLQNFPLLIQTPQTKINNCFKQPHVTRSVCTINTTNVTTNTSEDHHDKQDEAFKLIKDIYDSLAMDVEIPTKDIPVGNHENIINPPLKNSYPSESKVGKVVTPLNSFFTKPVKNTISLHNKSISKTNNLLMSAGEAVNSPGMRQRKEEEKIKKYFVNEMFESRKPNNDDVTLTDSSETSDSDTEMEDVQPVSKSGMNVKIQEKKSLFSKIINSVKMFKNMERKKKQMNNESEESETSYIYEYIKPTYGAPKSRNYNNQIVLNRLHTANQSPGNFKNVPYLDQEYRRRWEENLMFHNNKSQNISSYDRPSGPSRCSAVQGSRNTAVWRYFDGRSTINHRTQTIDKIKNPCNVSLNKRREDNTKIGVQRLHWLRKQNGLKLSCAPHWKKLILEG